MAVLLDFEPFRKPFYYWDNIENLADELRSLVFALWFEQDDVSVSGSGEDDDGGYRTFWYNDISGAILFGETKRRRPRSAHGYADEERFNRREKVGFASRGGVTRWIRRGGENVEMAESEVGGRSTLVEL